MLQAALSHAARGWRVFRLEAAGKVPLPGSAGFKDATTDEDTIRRWWAETPDANVGIATGAESGLLVIDVDPRHGGAETLAELERRHGSLPKTPRVRTGGGGLHYYYNPPGGTVRSRANALGPEWPGIDVRADGGYVVAPPSRHTSGRMYEWELHPDDAQPADVPEWLRELFIDPHLLTISTSPSSAGLVPIPEGERNTRLTSLAGRLRRDGLEASEIDAALQIRNRTACNPPLSEREVTTIAQSIGRYPSAEGGQQQPAESSVRYLDLESIRSQGIPQIDWILPDWLATKDVALLAGAAGVGKSTTAADLAVACSSGRPWCGMTPTRPVKILYFDEEQDEETTARLFLRLGAPHDNLKVASGQGIRLDTPEGLAKLEQEIRAWRPCVVFLDSAQKVFGAADENSATQVGLVYADLHRMRDQCGVAFVIVHHKKKTNPKYRIEALELVRGSTAHTTQSTTVWFASGGGSEVMFLTQAKRRGATKQSLRISYHEEGDLIRLVGEGPVEEAETASQKAEDQIVAHLEGRPEARAADIIADGEKENHAQATLKRALNRLVVVKSVERVRRGVYRLRQGSTSESDDG